MSESIVREAVQAHREQLCSLIDALLDDRDRLLSDLVRIRETSSNVFEYLDDRFSFCSGNAPGHAHSRPGIWDKDNGAKSGTECEWCKLWGAFRAEIERGGAKANQGGADHE